MTAALAGLLGPLGPLGGIISGLFARMAIAEEEITRVYPVPRSEPRELFRALCPTAELRELSDDLYRMHVRELVERACAGGMLELYTRAEVLAGLSAASLKAPLNRVGQELAEQLFRELLPKAAARAFPEPARKLTGYDAMELRDALQRRLRRENGERTKAMREGCT
jgi:hypothetical protein